MKIADCQALIRSSNHIQHRGAQIMKMAALLLISMAALSCAEDNPTKQPEEKRRLESVSWNLKDHKLVWVVSKGRDENGKFVPSATEKYEITPDDASMAFNNEKRGFSKDEANSLHQLLDTLSLYCAESVIWWDDGQGTKLDDKNAPDEKKKKVDTRPAAPPAPGPKVMVAQAAAK